MPKLRAPRNDAIRPRNDFLPSAKENGEPEGSPLKMSDQRRRKEDINHLLRRRKQAMGLFKHAALHKSMPLRALKPKFCRETTLVMNNRGLVL